MSSRRLICDREVQILELKQHQQANIALKARGRLQVTSRSCARQVVL